jgi:hypothetical protein
VLFRSLSIELQTAFACLGAEVVSHPRASLGPFRAAVMCKPHVGVFVAPANATSRVQQQADWVTSRKGGDTAVREMIEILLDAQGLLKPTEDYFIGTNQ